MGGALSGGIIRAAASTGARAAARAAAKATARATARALTKAAARGVAAKAARHVATQAVKRVARAGVRKIAKHATKQGAKRLAKRGLKWGIKQGKKELKKLPQAVAKEALNEGIKSLATRRAYKQQQQEQGVRHRRIRNRGVQVGGFASFGSLSLGRSRAMTGNSDKLKMYLSKKERRDLGKYL